jgi:hypothetical protein
MTRSARAFRRHAETVVDLELRRARGRLGRLPLERRRAVEELSVRVAVAVVDGVLEQARDEPSLAQALLSIYGLEPGPGTRAVLWAPD